MDVSLVETLNSKNVHGHENVLVNLFETCFKAASKSSSIISRVLSLVVVKELAKLILIIVIGKCCSSIKGE